MLIYFLHVEPFYKNDTETVRTELTRLRPHGESNRRSS